MAQNILNNLVIQGADTKEYTKRQTDINCVGSSRALVLASGCYFRSVHAGTNEVRASQLAQA